MLDGDFVIATCLVSSFTVSVVLAAVVLNKLGTGSDFVGATSLVSPFTVSVWSF